jgi:hypothetical protein
MRSSLARVTALLAVALIAACSGAGGPQSPSRSQPAAASPTAASSPPLTAAAAKSVLRNYAEANNAANNQADASLEDRIETAPQSAIDGPGLVIAAREHQGYVSFGYQNPVFYIPVFAGPGPRWFAADAMAVPVSGGTAHRQLLLFAQQRQGAPWKLAAGPLALNSKVLPVSLNAAGNAATVAPGEAGLAILPGQLPARHAELFSGQSPAAVWAPGPVTDGALRNITAYKHMFSSAGWRYHIATSAAGYPVYALRAKDGGAVVWYVLRERQTGVRVGAGLAVRQNPIVSGLTEAVAALAGKPPIRKFTIDSLNEYVAIVPAKGSGKVAAVADFTGYVSATAS